MSVTPSVFMPNITKTILVTGSAGFIGFNLVLRLLESEEPLNIVGLDNLNDYYDPSLKEYRLGEIQKKAAKLRSMPTSPLPPPLRWTRQKASSGDL